MALYIGCMSGTSLDGVDAVLANLQPAHPPEVLAHQHEAFDDALRTALLRLNRSGDDEIHLGQLAANAVARAYARCAQALLEQTGRRAQDVIALGAHGQTVRHRPLEFDAVGYTVQLLNGALLAELTGIDVVCDLRSADVAAGGQGAPLVPAFHAALFARDPVDKVVLNLGGMANLTLLPAGSTRVLGYDCGPGNVLLDGWCESHTGQRFDTAGRWAAAGRPHMGLLAQLLADPYFARLPPKSTGRDHFDRGWLSRHLDGLAVQPSPQDVAATLTELTAATAADAIARDAPQARELLVCGGGAFNEYLMARLAARLPRLQVVSTAARGVPPDQVEALAFAWLAWARVERRCGNLPAVTGAAGARVLGALYAGK
jgi:anhydro-N-acetylmuramic acid kinase